jgi:hypothetical protein
MRVLQGRSRHHKQNEGGQDKHLQDHSRGLALGAWRLVWIESHNRAIAWNLYLFIFIATVWNNMLATVFPSEMSKDA